MVISDQSIVLRRWIYFQCRYVLCRAYASVLFKNVSFVCTKFVGVLMSVLAFIDFSTISQMISEGDKGGIALGTHGPFFGRAICTGWHG